MNCDMDTRIGYWLKITSRRVANLHDQKLAPYGISNAQLSILIQLWNKDGLTQKEMHSNIEVTAATFTGLLNSLEVKGYVTRKADENDARVNRVFLTREGESLKTVCMGTMYEMRQTVSKGLTQGENLILVELLKKIYNNLGG